LSDADFSRQMNHAVDAAQGIFQGGLVPYIGDDQFRLTVQARGPTLTLVHLFDQRIQHANTMSTIEQGSYDVTADETRATSDKDSFSQCADSRMERIHGLCSR
jgi:hypothetical protein